MTIPLKKLSLCLRRLAIEDEDGEQLGVGVLGGLGQTLVVVEAQAVPEPEDTHLVLQHLGVVCQIRLD